MVSFSLQRQSDKTNTSVVNCARLNCLYGQQSCRRASHTLKASLPRGLCVHRLTQLTAASPPCLSLSVVEIQTIQRASFYDTSLDEPAGERLGHTVVDLGQNSSDLKWALLALHNVKLLTISRLLSRECDIFLPRSGCTCLHPPAVVVCHGSNGSHSLAAAWLVVSARQ